MMGAITVISVPYLIIMSIQGLLAWTIKRIPEAPEVWQRIDSHSRGDSTCVSLD